MPIDSDVPSRHGMFWEQWEEEQLERMYMCMVSIEDMGKRIGRSPVAIASRLEKLGLLVHVGSGVYISRKHADGQTIEQPKIFAPRSKS
jgi:predicted transcriptional regulator of viral defense system